MDKENIEKKDMVLTVNSVPAVIQVNFTQLKINLQEELTKYDVVVTIDTVKEAKKLSTELNKIARDIDLRRKEEISKVSEPIKAFDDDMFELIAMCKDGRTKLLSQVTKFEDVTKKKVEQLLSNARSQLFKEHDIKDEFKRAKFDDLILISNITINGNLTKAAMDTLTMRVRDDRAIQDMVDMRLVKLENASYRAGLSLPLTKDHILPFITYNDESYEKELSRIINVEVQRQKETEKAALRKVEQEKQREEEVAHEEKERKEKVEQEEKERVEQKEAEKKQMQQATETVSKEHEDAKSRFLKEHGVNDDEIFSDELKEPEKEYLPVVTADLKSEEPAPQLKNNEALFTVIATFQITASSEVPYLEIKERLNDLFKQIGITTPAPMIEVRPYA